MKFILKILRILPFDKLYLKLLFRYRTGKKLNLKEPQTFNEKLQWLKLNDRKKTYTKMVEKYDAKEYVSNIIGKEYIIPTIGVYDKFDEIDFKNLPNQFVIKCTHDSGGIVICKNKKELDIESAKKKINKSLNKNFFYHGREWPYKNIKPRIIVEKFMKDDKYSSMRDYKFFCFNGKPEIMYLSEGLEDHSTAGMSFFDMNFKLLPLKRKDYHELNYNVEKPKNFEKMKKFAEMLSKDIPHIRVDFYEINGKLFFGELTFYTCSGFVPFEPEEWDYKLGKMINLNGVKKNEK